LQKISLITTLRFSFFFLSTEFGAIAARIALPALASWLVLYGSARLYLSELVAFLGLPSDRSGSVILGLLAAGLLGLLFLHAVLTLAVATFAASVPEKGWPRFGAKRAEWRLYAAYLRILFVLVVFVSAIIFLDIAFIRYLGEGATLFLFNIVIFASLSIILVRAGLLAAPIVVAEASGPIVRRSLSLSRGNSVRLFLLFVVLILPGVIFEICTEALLRYFHVFPTLPVHLTFLELVKTYDQILPGILAILMMAYLIVAVLLTLAAVSVYRQLVDSEG
jgi:hypothetical protein